MHLRWLSRMSTPRPPNAARHNAFGQSSTTIQWNLRSAVGYPACIPPSATADAPVSSGCSPSNHGATGGPSFTDAEHVHAEHSRRGSLCLGAHRHQWQPCRLRSRQTTWRIAAANRLSRVESPPGPIFIWQTKFSNALRLWLCLRLQQFFEQRPIWLRRPRSSLRICRTSDTIIESRLHQQAHIQYVQLHILEIHDDIAACLSERKAVAAC